MTFMSNHFLKMSAKIGFSLVLALAAGALLLGRASWAGGVMVSACWMFLNIYFLYRLLEVGLKVENSKHPGRLLALSVLKFPVIYLTGYFILKTRFFPIESVLAGLTLFMIGLGAAW